MQRATTASLCVTTGCIALHGINFRGNRSVTNGMIAVNLARRTPRFQPCRSSSCVRRSSCPLLCRNLIVWLSRTAISVFGRTPTRWCRRVKCRTLKPLRPSCEHLKTFVLMNLFSSRYNPPDVLTVQKEEYMLSSTPSRDDSSSFSSHVARAACFTTDHGQCRFQRSHDVAGFSLGHSLLLWQPLVAVLATWKSTHDLDTPCSWRTLIVS